MMKFANFSLLATQNERIFVSFVFKCSGQIGPIVSRTILKYDYNNAH